MSIEIDYDLFVEHIQNYSGHPDHVFLGVGTSPHAALDDALDSALEIYGEGEDDSPEATEAARIRREALLAFENHEDDVVDPDIRNDPTGELLWHCGLVITEKEER